MQDFVAELRARIKRNPHYVCGCVVPDIVSGMVETVSNGGLVSVSILASHIIRIQNDGRGISVEPLSSTNRQPSWSGLCYLECLLTVPDLPMDSAKSVSPRETFEYGKGFHVEFEIASAGLYCGNAFSHSMEVTTVVNDRCYRIATREGVVIQPVSEISGFPQDRGTCILWEPSPDILPHLQCDFVELARRLRDLVLRRRTFAIRLHDDRPEVHKQLADRELSYFYSLSDRLGNPNG